MLHIYSNTEPKRLLHLVCRRGEMSERRLDLCPDSEGLQVACFRLPEGKTFRPHRHIVRPRTIERTQEAWIVISGEVEATFFDEDGTELQRVILRTGDCSITLAGGHTYRCLQDWTEVYEFKLGPYIGSDVDKEYFDDSGF